MRLNVVSCLLFLLLSAGISLAQDDDDSTPPEAAKTDVTQPAAAPSSGEIRGTFPASLAKSLDSKKLKEGDPVVCQTAVVLHSRSGLMIPIGSKVYGHITQATARSTGSESSTLAMVFDKVEVSPGSEIIMKGTLQAIAPTLDPGPTTGAAGSATLDGHSHEQGTNPGTTPGPMPVLSGPNMGPDNKKVLKPQSQGVSDMKGLQMDKDSIITSAGKEVKLERGTQMMIRAVIEIPVQ